MTYMRANYKWRTYASLSTGSDVVYFNAETWASFTLFYLISFDSLRRLLKLSAHMDVTGFNVILSLYLLKM